MPRRLVLQHGCSPGDIVVMTAAVRDLQRAYPGQFEVDVHTPCKELWANNPYVIPGLSRVGTESLELCYGRFIVESQTRPLHFLESFHLDLQRHLKCPVPVTDPRPDLHLSQAEQAHPQVDGRYWVMLAGGKRDFTTKQWPYARYQTVATMMAACGLKVVQAGALEQRDGHKHPTLSGVINLLGKTNLRELMALIYHSEGVICGITMAMHMAAAFEKPAVILGAGREEWWWEAYSQDNQALGEAAQRVRVSHHYLHTIGLLPCCEKKACWRNKVTRAEPDNKQSYCHHPVPAESGQMVALCHRMIPASRVFEAVMSYYLDGTLSVPEGVVIPAIDFPITVELVDGRKATVSLNLADDQRIVPDSIPEVPVLASPPAPPHLNWAPPPAARLAAIQAKPISNTGIQPIAHQPLRQVRLPTPPAPPAPPPFVPTPTGVANILDEPSVGGRFTCCILFYGDYHDMHRRCLDLVLASHHANRLDLRVATNAASKLTEMYLQDLHHRGRVQAYYPSPENRKKYPVQRLMWYDPARPINTKWVIWLDDDTMCTRPDWLTDLARRITERPEVALVGPRRFYSVRPSQLAWMQQASWWRQRPLQDVKGRETPNGDKVHFAVGACYAIRTDAIRTAEIPDVRLAHNGGDWLTGAQLWQHGFEMADWTGRKEVVQWSSVPRRGLSEAHPGL